MDLFKGITVLSLEQATVVPYLTYRMAQDGMSVIRLEHPVYGDPNRMIGDNILNEERMNSYFMCINAGKKALTLNLAESEGRKLFKLMLKKLDVDIFITNQLPRNYAKLGIDFESVQSVKPDIVWMGVTGFGPDSNEGAYDPILQARSGLMDLTGEADGDPQVLGIPLPDMGTSEHAYGLLMKALYKKEKTGQGSRLDVSMFQSCVSWLTVPITLNASFGKSITRRGNTHEFFSPVSVYQTKDGYVYLAVGNDRQWKALVSMAGFESMDRPEYEKNAGRIQNVQDLNKALNEITRTLTSAELIENLNAITVPVSEIKAIQDVIQDPLVAEKLLHSKDPVTGRSITLAPPPHQTPFLEAAESDMSFPPRFGEHNQEIYGGLLEYSAQALTDLKAKGII